VKDLIHFAHGNGFPALCYKQLLNKLAERYDYCYIDRIGHNPEFPITENWYFLIEEVIASIKKQTSQPVIGLGHSLGGVLSLLAAIKEPLLFKAVIMIDSPLLGRFKSSMVCLAKALGVIDRVTPAARTRSRREHWQNREQLFTYLKSRKLFQTFSEKCLQDYIDYGLQQIDQGYVLRFDRHNEYLIYRTIPHIFPAYEGKLKVPVALIYGNESTVIDRQDVRYMKKYYNILCCKMEGTHMLPMEYPTQVATQVFTILDAILK
jgi:pimeloyl-ACP methyl ester carboxylesterase